VRREVTTAVDRVALSRTGSHAPRREPWIDALERDGRQRPGTALTW
jgi:hypothetical protein